MAKKRKANKPTVKKSEGIGLGDMVEKVTEATGIKSVVDYVSDLLGMDCGCPERKERMNKIRFFQKFQPELMTLEEYLYIKDYLNNIPYIIKREQQLEVLKVYNRIFHLKQTVTSCADCWRNINTKLNEVIKGYESTEREGTI